jgi:hypothetical protein
VILTDLFLAGLLGLTPIQLILAEAKAYEATLRAEPDGDDAQNNLQESDQPQQPTSYHAL